VNIAFNLLALIAEKTQYFVPVSEHVTRRDRNASINGTWVAQPGQEPTRNYEVFMFKYYLYSSTIASAATLETPKSECLVWSLDRFSSIQCP
jgi:hypothetical protein